MKSIRPRFLLLSAIIITLALTAAALAFIVIFERNIERRIDAELTSWGNQIAANLSFDQEGKLLPPDELSDMRFSTAYGGLYWQIDDPLQDDPLRSRSLWDFVLDLPRDQHDAGAIHVYNLPGPENTELHVQERSLIVATPVGSRSIRITLATDRAALTLARDRFVQDILPYVIVLGVFLLAASAFQLSLGLRPLSRVSSDLKLIEEAPGKRLDGQYPREISELVSAVNSLLDANEKTITKSRSRAADLAHGLKTPLTVLANNGEKLRKAGKIEMANEIASMCAVMQSHVDHELTRSRIAEVSVMGTARTDFAMILDEVRRTLGKTPKGEYLEWKREGDMTHIVRIDPHDLRELIGNILENAVKWTTGMIMVRAKKEGDFLQVSIEDDGPGVASDKIDQLTARGKRFDETISGTGFGLSIVQDIVENYNLPFSIQNRQTNGLIVTVGLPLADKSKSGS